MNVSRERTGWRDFGFSLHHRTWGFDCPSTDLDFCLIEYNSGEPVALIEYKNQRAKVEISGSNIICIRRLADRGSLPAFVVGYTDDYSCYGVYPLNTKAKNFIQLTGSLYVVMDEYHYVKLLYEMRGLPMPRNLKLYQLKE